MKIIRKLNEHFEEYLLVILFSTMVTVLFSQIMMRVIFNSSLSWSEELTRYCFIYLVFIGISYAVKKKRHLKLTLLYNQFSEKGQKILSMISNVLFLLFSFFILYYGTLLTINNFEFGQVTPSLGMPMWIVTAAAPFGIALTIVRLIQNMYYEIKG